MKEFRTSGGPYRLRLQYEVTEIDQICEDALRHSGLIPKEPQAVKIDRFLEKYFEIRVIYDDLGEDVLGCTLFDKRGRVTGIMISSRIEEGGTKSGERRARSTLAHEGGHGLLHPKLFMEDSTPSLFKEKPSTELKFMCRKSDIAPATASIRYDGKWWEWQANRAIGGLLLPKSLVRKAASKYVAVGKFGPMLPENRREELEASLADTFEVNPVVAKIRLQELYPSDLQRSF